MLCSEDGDEQYGGIYCYEMDAINKFAPELAKSVMVAIKRLAETRTDFASTVILFQRAKGFGDCNFDLDILLACSDIAKKRNVNVYLVKLYGGRYNIWQIYPKLFVHKIHINPVFYTFKRCGLEMFKSKDSSSEDGFNSIDWKELQDYVLSK